MEQNVETQTMGGDRQPVCMCKCARHIGLLLLRVGLGGMVLVHGYPKLLELAAGRGGDWMDPLGLGPTFSLVLCVFAEFFCSLAVMAGFMTRAAALVLGINFCVILFTQDMASAPALHELVLLYLLCFAALVCTGSGRLGLDRLLFRPGMQGKCCLCGCATRRKG